MPRSKRYTSRNQPTPAVREPGDRLPSPLVSEPVALAQSSPPVSGPTQNPLTAESSNGGTRKSNNYWTVHVTNADGSIETKRLKVLDVWMLPNGQRVVLEWNEFGQPVGESAGLLEGFLGAVASNFNNFPICYSKWPKVPSSYKDHVFDNTIKTKFVVNDNNVKKYMLDNLGKKWKDNRLKLFDRCYRTELSREANIELPPEGISKDHWATFIYYRLSKATKNVSNMQRLTIPHTLRSKTIARRKRELEIETGRSYSRGEMFAINRKKKDDPFVNEEAGEMNDLLERHKVEGSSSQTDSGQDAFGRVFRPERHGRVRDMDFGVSPTQGFGSTPRQGMTSSSTARVIALKGEIDALKKEMAIKDEQYNATRRELEEMRLWMGMTLGGNMESPNRGIASSNSSCTPTGETPPNN